MINVCGNPANLSSENFFVVFNGMDNLVFKLTSIDVPGIALPSPELGVSNGYRDISFHGDRLDKEDLVLSFIVDENLKNWYTAYDWIKRQVNTTERLGDDCTIRYTDNSGKRGVAIMRYEDCIPTALSSFTMSVVGDQQVIVAQLTLDYIDFSINLE